MPLKVSEKRFVNRILEYVSEALYIQNKYLSHVFRIDPMEENTNKD